MRVVILGSGSGTNARAILEAELRGDLGDAEVVAVFSDLEDTGILKHAEGYHVPGYFLDPGSFKTKLEGEGEARYIEALRKYEPDLVVLAGFMRVIKSQFLRAFPFVINLHPSLLPAFPGLNAIQQAWDYGVRVSGCTVHWVNEEVDRGRIIDQVSVRREEEDTFELFNNKIHKAEHELLPAVIERLSYDKNLFGNSQCVSGSS